MTRQLNKVPYTRSIQINCKLSTEQIPCTSEPAGFESLSHLRIHHVSVALIHELFKYGILHEET